MNIELKDEIIRLASDVYYKNGFFNDVEFKKDLYNLFIIRKMINRFLKTGNINEKLLLNNIIIAINVFGIMRINLLFELILTREEFGVIKSALLFLNCYKSNSTIDSNRIINDILRDVANRYNLGDVR